MTHAFFTQTLPSKLPSNGELLSGMSPLSSVRRRTSIANTNIQEQVSTNNNVTKVETSARNETTAITKATNRNKKKLLKSGREKRRKFIGLAKAVDRGQWQNTYSPGGAGGASFVAKSGLPDVTKPFCVLGIESSCDDTGGK